MALVILAQSPAFFFFFSLCCYSKALLHEPEKQILLSKNYHPLRCVIDSQKNKLPTEKMKNCFLYQKQNTAVVAVVSKTGVDRSCKRLNSLIVKG